MWKDSNALSFNTGAPVHQSGFELTSATSFQRSVTISSRYGNLKIAGELEEVLNSFGDTMEINNGYALWFCDNVLIPAPCSGDSLYYLLNPFVQAPNTVITGPLKRWLIDVNANNGQGEVVSMSNLADTGMGQAIVATRHGNNRDYWAITKNKDPDNEFHAWHISDTGIITTPVVSVTGPQYSNLAVTDQLGVNPRGDMVAWSAVMGGSTPNLGVRLFLFDKNSGQLSYFCTLNTSSLANTHAIRCSRFSPDGGKLYVFCTFSILQFDLSSGNASTIANSAKIIHSISNNGHYYDGQIGLDNKMYLTRGIGSSAPNALGVINNPNDTGSACNYVHNAITTNQKTKFLLPHIIYNLYVPRIIEHDSIECTLDTTSLYFDNYLYFDSASWYIDTGSAQVVVSSDSVAYYVFDSAGTYPIMAVTYSGCRLDTIYDTILVIPAPTPNLGPDTILCEGDTIAISNDWLYTYLWSTGDTTVGIEILAPDTYWLQLSNYCGVAADTVVIDSIIAALVHFPTDDTLLCDGDTLWLDASVDAGTYEWHDASNNATFGATQSDTVWVSAQNACGTSSDTIRVRFTDIPVIPVLDSVLCNGTNYVIDLSTDSFSMFVWYDGDSTAIDTITLQNTYWVEEWNICGHDSSNFMVAFVNDPQTLLGNDTVLCISESLVLDATTPFGTYVWNTGDTSGAITIDQTYLTQDSNHYIVTVYNACKADTDNITIAVDFMPVIDLGPDPVVCVGDTLTLQTDSITRTLYQWNDGLISRSRELIASLNLAPSYLLLATNSCGSTSDEITVFVDQPLAVDLGPDLNPCFGDTITLSASITPDTARTSYFWYDGLTADSRKLIASNSLATSYSLLVTNQCGSAQDSIHLSIDSLPANYFRDTIRFCRNQSTEVNIEKLDIDSLSWSDGSSSKTKIISAEALYFISFYNHCGRTRDTLIAKRQELPVIDITSPQNLCDQQLILELSYDLSLETYAYSWNDSSHHDYLPVTEPGTYNLTLTDAWGCKDSAEITVKTCGADWYAPNSFTPDGDGLNEFWKPVGEGIINYEAIIFDRWGNAIFTFNQNDSGWDGTVKGSPIQPGVYGWLLNIETEDRPKGYSTMGQVVLVR